MSGGRALRGSLIPVLRHQLPRLGMFHPDELAVLAVSGGPDSLFLLHCFSALRETLGLRLHVAHVHHGLRGQDAEEDAAFVADQAAKFGLPCTIIRLDPAALRRRSLQAAAREARYAALRTVAESRGGGCIVTAHTEDDQAETLLLQLLRGSGLDGLSGIRPRLGDLVRPLLGISRAAIDAHCRAHGLTPRQDVTNHSRKYRRNALRLDLMPRMERYNPSIRRTLARTASALARDADFLHEQADRALDALITAEAGTLSLDLAGLAALHAGLRLHTLRAAVSRLLGSTEGWTMEHLETIDALIATGCAGRVWSLPRGVRAEVSERKLVLTIHRSPSSSLCAVQLPVPGTARFGQWHLETTIAAPPAQPRATWRGEGVFEAWCDRRAIGAPLQVRSRLPGDRLRPLGLGGTKKVQDVLVDRKVPRSVRDTLPIVSGPSGIIWIVGHMLDEHAALTASTVEAIRICAHVIPARAE